LTPDQLEAACLVADGVAVHVIAGTIGTTQVTIDSWMRNPKFKSAIKLYQSGALERAFTARGASQMIENATSQAAQTLVEAMGSEKEEIKVKAATEILDRGGHGKKVEVQKTVVNLDAEFMKRLQETGEMLEIPEGTAEVIDGEV